MSKIIKKKIQDWFEGKNIKLDEKTDIFSSKKIDSFNFIELLVFIENKFKIKINHEQIYSKKKLNINDLILIIGKSANIKIKKKSV